MKIIKLIAPFLLFFCGAELMAEPQAKVVITQQTKNLKPIPHEGPLSLSDQRIFLFVTLSDLVPKEAYAFNLKIFDGSNRKVHSSNDMFTSLYGTINKVSLYKFNPERDYPGDWTILLTVGEKELFRKIVYVYE